MDTQRSVTKADETRRDPKQEEHFVFLATEPGKGDDDSIL